MKTLEQYNIDYKKQREESERLKYMTGISCPHCVTVEMKYGSPDVLLCSYPPQKRIFCPECNFKTNIFV
jgi:hypothetical protein